MNPAGERLKLFLLMGALAAVVYFGTQHSTLYAAFPMPASAIDRVIRFQWWFIVPYLSFFLLIVLPLFIIGDRQQVRDVAFGFGLIVTISGVMFLFWPTAVTSPVADSLKTLLALDTPRNACPSLHASLALFCTLCMNKTLESRWARLGLWMWAILAVISTVLIKRHVAIDIAAGAALGWLVHFILFREERTEDPDSAAVVETLRIRNQLAQESNQELAALRHHDGAERAKEFTFFFLLATAGMLLSIWSRSTAWTLGSVAGILVTAVALNSFPLLMHEGMHGILFPNRAWNWAVSVFLGATFLMSFSSYRVLHIRHHRYLGDPRDPDDYHNYSRSRGMVWFLHFVRLTFGPLLYVFLIPILALKYGTPAQRKHICIEYTILFAIYSALLRAVPARALFFVWFVPLLLMGVFTAIRGFTQHGITDAADPYLASRTMLPNPVIAFFLLNENYHLEHHLFPEMPSYHLARLHQLIWPKLPRAVAGHSYLAFLGSFLKATPRMDETPIGLRRPEEEAQ